MPSIIHEACSQYKKGHAFVVLARFEDQSELFDPKVVYRIQGSSHWKQATFSRLADGTHKATIPVKDLKGPIEYFIEVFDELGNGPARMGDPESPLAVTPDGDPEPCEQVPQAAPPPDEPEPARPTPPPEQPPPTPTPPVRPPPVEVPPGQQPPTIVEPQRDPMKEDPPPPPPSACEMHDAPVYCKTWFWITVGAGALALGGIIAGVAIATSGGEPVDTDPASVDLIINGPSPVPQGLRVGGRP